MWGFLVVAGCYHMYRKLVNNNSLVDSADGDGTSIWLDNFKKSNCLQFFTGI